MQVTDLSRSFNQRTDCDARFRGVHDMDGCKLELVLRVLCLLDEI